MKGIILAGGSGSRLLPATFSISKQLIPVYDKPMIFYPLSILMLANIKEILIITTPRDLGTFQNLLGDGSKYGVSLQYKVQENPNGIAEALKLGESFLQNEPVCLILGDNIFYGSGLIKKLESAAKLEKGARVFAYNVNDPSRFGIIEFDKEQNVLSIEEKPTNPKSDFAVTGIYFYDKTAVEKVKSLQPSKRGELEITDLNNLYVKENSLKVDLLGRGVAWLDTGTHSSLLDASNFIETVEKRQGLKISCLEEIAFNKGWITKEQLKNSAESMKNSDYGKYLFRILRNLSWVQY